MIFQLANFNGRKTGFQAPEKCVGSFLKVTTLQKINHVPLFHQSSIRKCCIKTTFRKMLKNLWKNWKNLWKMLKNLWKNWKHLWTNWKNLWKMLETKTCFMGFAASLEACARSPTLLPVQALGIELIEPTIFMAV